MVEVSRRSSSPNDPQGKKSSIKSNPSSCEDSRLRVVETSVQTDWIEMPIDLKTDYANKDPFGPENTLEGGFDEDIYDIFDQEMDYEEIRLVRDEENCKFGITLCYIKDGSDTEDDELEENVFVRELEVGSLAAVDGRLREGDQVLQINGHEVRSQKEAETMFAESGKEITFLVARAPQQNYVESSYHLPGVSEEDVVSDGYLQIDRNAMEESCPSHHDSGVGLGADEGISSLPRTEGSNSSIIEPVVSPSPEDGSFDKERDKEPIASSCSGTNSSKSSLASRRSSALVAGTDTELYMIEKKMSDIQLDCRELEEKNLQKNQCSTESEPEHIYETIPGSTVIDEPIYCVPFEPKKAKKNSKRPVIVRDKSIDKSKEVHQWLRHLLPSSEGVKNIHPESSKPIKTCEKWFDKVDPNRWPDKIPDSAKIESGISSWNKTSSTKNSSSSGDSAKKAKEQRRRPKEQEPRLTMSLGQDLCQSTLFLNPISNKIARSFRPSDENQACKSCQNCRQVLPKKRSMLNSYKIEHSFNATNYPRSNRQSTFPPHASEAKHNVLNQRIIDSSRNVCDSQKFVEQSTGVPPVMYTDAANLQQTIMLQQKLFRDNLLKQQQRQSAEPEMEWRVNKGPDGTRYVSRRPVRDRILKDRARTVTEERAGLTTDDDAMSELKIGRYWSKEERKVQVDKSKERKKKSQHPARIAPPVQFMDPKMMKSKRQEDYMSEEIPLKRHAFTDGVLTVTIL
ncbi:PDZ domain-containing RING finger protein 4-like isoform X2 [Artemia franciscana]